eukprot:5296668-Pyramimonas_sp.AAC.1
MMLNHLVVNRRSTSSLQPAFIEITCFQLNISQLPLTLSKRDVTRSDAEEMVACAGQAVTTKVHTIPEAGHYLIEDSPLELRQNNCTVSYVVLPPGQNILRQSCCILLKVRWAVRLYPLTAARARGSAAIYTDKLCDCIRRQANEALAVHDKAARRPELLGLRKLPEYNSLEEAIKALKPRKIPTAQAINEALAKLRLTDEAPSDEDDEHKHRRTGLAKDNPEYFGFVG